jgi:hypothetical protein
MGVVVENPAEGSVVLTIVALETTDVGTAEERDAV